MQFRYNSLDDYLLHNTLSIDKSIEDGWGVRFQVKGCEIEAVILFADITNFSGRTNTPSAMHTLAFANHFITWITAEAVKHSPGIVDKYIGDEVMIVFSKEFGSSDPLKDALITARWIGERDVWSFCPHMGIAGGNVMVGYIGTPVKYSCSVFGLPVTVASRCANHKLPGKNQPQIILPSELWTYDDINTIFPPVTYADSNGKSSQGRQDWHAEKTHMNVKGMKIDAIAIIHGTLSIPSQSAEDYVKEALNDAK
ncbi:MAG: adenylate/guanylate cyclase domain-containing protein [Ignavibacteria bacterium]|nr:adenylate/guanylate cyclase domain-containing protein [Ignavibacteria bacterium]